MWKIKKRNSLGRRNEEQFLFIYLFIFPFWVEMNGFESNRKLETNWFILLFIIVFLANLLRHFVKRVNRRYEIREIIKYLNNYSRKRSEHFSKYYLGDPKYAYNNWHTMIHGYWNIGNKKKKRKRNNFEEGRKKSIKMKFSLKKFVKLICTKSLTNKKRNVPKTPKLESSLKIIDPYCPWPRPTDRPTNSDRRSSLLQRTDLRHRKRERAQKRTLTRNKNSR